MLCIKSIETEEVKLMLGVSLIIIAAAIVYMVETYISTYYTIEYMHGTSLFLILLAKYGTPVLFLLQYMPAADARAYMRGINTKDILRHPFAIRENNCTVGEISVIHTKTGFLQGYNSIAMQLYGEEYQSYKIGFGKEGVCCPVFLGGQQIAQINKSAVVKDNLDEYLIYAVNEKALMPSVMFAIYIDGIYYANRGMYVDDATTINCEYSLNEEVLSHYDPNFVKGL